MLAVLAVLTWRHAGIYRDGVTLFTHIVAHNPTARFAHRNLGEALTVEDRWGRSAGRLSRPPPGRRRTTDRDHSNVGGALVVLDRLDEAEERLRHALSLDPKSTYALQNMASLAVRRKRYGEALDLYRRLVGVSPPQSERPTTGVGTALYFLGRPAEALKALERALALDPGARRHTQPTATRCWRFWGGAAR